MTYYERNLPHWHPSGASLFLTWRLFGSLPRGFAGSQRLKPGGTAGKRFRVVDLELDRAKHGPLWLKAPRIAGCVADAIERGESVLQHYLLHAFVVMANHVHLLILPRTSVARITNGIKGVTAREANRILGRTGKPFWQDESFDHWVRSTAELGRIRAYIEHNPVSAGLVKRPEDWPWSSAAGPKLLDDSG